MEILLFWDFKPSPKTFCTKWYLLKRITPKNNDPCLAHLIPYEFSKLEIVHIILVIYKIHPVTFSGGLGGFRYTPDMVFILKYN